MPRVAALELIELDLPLRRPFRHAAATRERSGSLVLRCITDGGHSGFGETLPRRYVTGEDRGEAFDLLAERVLPRLPDLEFDGFPEVVAFLAECDGKAPREWVDPAIPQTAAWCAVDLALLDAFARAFGVDLHREPVFGGEAWPERLRYGIALSGGSRLRALSTLLKARAYGIRDVKVKVDGSSTDGVGMARRVLGRRARLRVDANMAWSAAEARTRMERLARHRIESFEQPVAADDIAGMAGLVAGTGQGVMADESLHDAASLERLIAERACTAVNVRIAKCGGLVAAVARCRRALEAGLTLQVGCQVGESSQLTAAQMVLVRAIGDGVRYVEGAYGERLLEEDPVRPRLEFGRRGRPPDAPAGGGGGFGTEADMSVIERWAGRRVVVAGVGAGATAAKGGSS